MPLFSPSRGLMAQGTISQAQPKMGKRRLMSFAGTNPTPEDNSVKPLSGIDVNYSRASILGVADLASRGQPMPDQRAIPSIMTPGSIDPGLDASRGTAIDERGRFTGMPSVATLGTMATISPRSEGVPQAASQRATSPNQPQSSIVNKVQGFTPQAVTGAPEFVNYYATETNPYDQNYVNRMEAQAINNAERQYTQAVDLLRSQLASRGLMAGGGTGLEAALTAQARMQAAGAREEALNRLALDTAGKRADYNLRRAEGLMQSQDKEFNRYVDQQLLPYKIAENQERVKQMMLENGINQYAIDQYMKMDVNEWPDFLKNAIKFGLIGGGLMYGSPELVAAGAAYR